MAALALPDNCVSTSCSDGLRALEQTFQAAPIGIAHVGADGTWLRVNQQVCDMLGYGAEELMALTFQDLTHPDDLNIDVGLANQVLLGDLERYRLEKRYFHKDGHIVWANLTVVIVTIPIELTVAISVIVLMIQQHKENFINRPNVKRSSSS